MKIQICMNKHDRDGRVTGRKVVQAQLLKERSHTVLVQLPDGSQVVRKKGRDVPHA